MTYEVAIIGTGADPEERTRDGYAMAYRHAPGYQRLDNCELVACADVVPDNAAAFAETFELDHVFTDHETLLTEIDPDIVSVCVPPDVHSEIVMDCATLGDPEAIHCEKPMATEWGDCKEMVAVCARQEVQLTIDHQRRFAKPVTEAKRLLDDGWVGPVRRLEWSEVNLFDAGSHLFDLCDFVTDGATPEWVLGGVNPDPDNEWFGVVNESQAIAQWGYEDGTVGLASTAEDERWTAVDAYLRIVGEDGVIEIGADDGPPLRVRTDGEWQAVDTDNETVYRPTLTTVQSAKNKVFEAVPGVSKPHQTGPSHYERAIEHLVSALDQGREPSISGRKALRGTELIFGCWESSRRQRRIDLPLTIEDNPLEALCTSQIEEQPEQDRRTAAPSESR